MPSTDTAFTGCPRVIQLRSYTHYLVRMAHQAPHGGHTTMSTMPTRRQTRRSFLQARIGDHTGDSTRAEHSTTT